MLLLNEYGDLPILFQIITLYNINNQFVNFWQKSHGRFYFRGTNLVLKEHKFLRIQPSL